MKFDIFKFHHIFNGLIGLNNLKLLHAQLDFVNFQSFTLNSVMPIHYIIHTIQFLFKLTRKPPKLVKNRILKINLSHCISNLKRNKRSQNLQICRPPADLYLKISPRISLIKDELSVNPNLIAKHSYTNRKSMLD